MLGRNSYSHKKIALAPYYAMYRLTRCTSYRTDRKGLGHFFGVAVVAFGFALHFSVKVLLDGYLPYLDDDLHLAVEACSPTLDQGHICPQAHFIHMSSRI